ncbi:MAG: hypothetical protein Q8N31_23305 [Reyranella sp.]|nr:hypothetical protein [Reyranella sp.]MDP3162951.1 hypothetical protein [Reyranella sp.]
MIASLPVRIYRLWLKEMKHILPPTLYFFVAFNLISFTTNLLTRNYWFHLTSFMVATGLALVVGKVVLVVDKTRIIDRFRGAPLIQPILYKTVFYAVVVFVVRVLERFIHLAFDDAGFSAAFEAAALDFSWRRFAAIQIWIFTCFLIYCTATELSALVGEGQMARLFLRHRSSQHRLTRRQHVRALMELSRLAETTPRDRLLDPETPQGSRLVSIVDALRQRPA